MISKQHIIVIVSLAVIFLSFSSSALAKTHQLAFMPLRIFFTDQKRTAVLRIINPTDNTLGYAISIISKRRNSEGKWVEVVESTKEETLIRKMVRFSPRRAVLEPGKGQLVKMLLRKPKGLPAGEYRAWIQLEPIPVVDDVEEGIEEENLEGKSFGVNILVKAHFPIIIQNGNLHSEVVAESIDIQPTDDEKSGYVANVKVRREGDASAIGKLEVEYHQNDKGKGRRVGTATAIAVYLDETSKNLFVPLRNITETELQTGHLKIRFHSEIKDGNGKIYPGESSSPRKFSLPLP